MEEIERIPLSRIRKAIEDNLDDDEHCVVESLPQEIIGVPLFICAIPGNNNFVEQEGILPMPSDLINRYEELVAIMNRVVGTPGTKRYDEMNRGDSVFPWELHTVVVDGEEYYIGFVEPSGVGEDGDSDEDANFYKSVTLFPCAYVDPER